MNCMHVLKKIIIFILFLLLAKPCFSAPIDRNNTIHTLLALISQTHNVSAHQRDIFKNQLLVRVDELIQIGQICNLENRQFQAILGTLMPQLILWGVSSCGVCHVDWVLTSIFQSFTVSIQQAVMMPVPAQASHMGNMPFSSLPGYPAVPAGGRFCMAPMPSYAPPQMPPPATRPVIDAHHVHHSPPPPPQVMINSPTVYQASGEAAPVEHSGNHDGLQVNNEDNRQSTTVVVENDRSKNTEHNEGQLVSDASLLTGELQHPPVSSGDPSSMTENKWPSLTVLGSEIDSATPVNSDSLPEPGSVQAALASHSSTNLESECKGEVKNKEIEDSDQSIDTAELSEREPSEREPSEREPSERELSESDLSESAKLKEEVSPASTNTQGTQTEESGIGYLDAKTQEIQSRIKALQANQCDIQKKMEDAKKEARLTQQRLKEELKTSENKQKTLKQQLNKSQHNLQTEKAQQKIVEKQLEEETERNIALQEAQTQNKKKLQKLKEELAEVRQSLQAKWQRQHAKNQAKEEEEKKLAEVLKKKQKKLEQELQSMGQSLAEARQNARTEREQCEKVERQTRKDINRSKELEDDQKAIEEKREALEKQLFEINQQLKEEEKKTRRRRIESQNRERESTGRTGKKETG